MRTGHPAIQRRGEIFSSARSQILPVAASLLLCALAATCLAQTTRPVATNDIKFESTPLADAIQTIRDRTGLNFNIDWSAIQTLGIDKTTPINLTVHGLSPGLELNLILDTAAPNHQLTYYVKNATVIVTTQAVADQDMVTRVYSIEDLLIQHQNFTQQVPFINISSVQAASVGGGGQQSNLQSSGAESPQELQAQKQKTADAIIAAITSSIRPEIWKQNGGNASILFLNGQLIITAPRSVQSAISGG